MLRAKLERFIPCPSGNATEPPYSAGQHGYWVLCTNPYAVEPAASPFSGETIYGIWRHTRGLTPGRDAFAFQQDIGTITHRIHKLDRSHATYEATAVQYADDITWIIENLNDANNAWILDGRKPVYEDLLSTVRDAEVPNQVLRALVKRDPGALYTYFIDDFVRTSEGRLTELAKNGGTDGRVALREAKPEAAIGLSAEAEAMLKSLDSYLTKHIFAEQRVSKRKEMLGTISSACLELLHKDNDGFLEHHVQDQAKLLNWTDNEKGRALELVADDVHRVQLAVTTFAGMGDVEIFNFVGISAS